MPSSDGARGKTFPPERTTAPPTFFALGGRVAGGFYGGAPVLGRLSGDGNLDYALDFRAVYASVLERWWGVPSGPTLAGRFAPVPFVRT